LACETISVTNVLYYEYVAFTDAAQVYARIQN
jgi:hypothetical protein